MKRIDHSTAVAGRFTQGDPLTGTPATVVTDEWLNQVQEEIASVIETAGITLDGEQEDQLYNAIQALIAAGVPNATATVRGIVELATDAEAVAGTDTERAVTPAGLAAAMPAADAVETLIVLPGAMLPADTDGVSPTAIVTTTNGLTIAIVPMPGDADSAVEWRLPMPSYWGASTLKFKVRWIPAAGATAADDVRFTLAACAAGPGDDIDLALGTAIAVDDQVVAVGESHETPASAALTVAGTPAAGDEVHFRLTRDHDYGTSPMAEDAQITAVLIQFGKSGGETAWA